MINRPIALSIAGYDPSGGAGVLADIKTFEQHKVLGMAITTSITYQTEDKFIGVDWFDYKIIKKQLKPILKHYKINYIKIGLIENFKVLLKLINYIKKKNNEAIIVWDPILRASANFDFKHKLNKKLLKEIFKHVTIITPNWNEAETLSRKKDVIVGCSKLAKHCNIVLKGGHNIETPGTDMLWNNNQLDILHPDIITNLEKHGSGCVFSSALLANLALNLPLTLSCQLAKNYTLKYIISNDTKLGYHK